MLPAVSSRKTWIVWLLASLFYGYQYILRILPNTIGADLVKIFNLNASQFGKFSGIYYVGYALMHIPAGLMLDRIGPKKVIPSCILLSVIGVLPLAYSESWLLVMIGRFLLGVGSTAAILGILKVIQLNFSQRYFTLLLALAVSMGLISAIYGGRPLESFVATFGMHLALQVLCGMGILLALATYIVTPPLKEDQINRADNIMSSLKFLLKQHKVILICLMGGLMIGPLEGFADAWSTPFLKTVYQISSEKANFMTSLVFIGLVCGPLLTFVADKTRAYYGFTIMCALMMAACFVLLLPGWAPLWLVPVLLWLAGWLCSYQSFVIYIASVSVPTHYLGITTACANMIIMVFGLFFHTVIGEVMNFNGAVDSSDGTLIYSPHAYVYGLAVIPIAMLISAIGVWMLRAPLPEVQLKTNK